MLSFAPANVELIRESNTHFIITGGGGWLGQATLEMLESALGKAFLQRVSVYGSHARTLTLRSNTTIECHALGDLASQKIEKPYYFHYAFVTRDKTVAMLAEEYIARNRDISSLVQSAIRHTGAAGIILPSSGAVYVRESRMIDTDIRSNPYGALKAQDEIAFYQLAKLLGAKIIVPRVFNMAGPFINKQEYYALSSMLNAAISGKSIAIHASHKVLRSYVHVEDIINLCFALLCDPSIHSPFIFDTYGEKAVELGELANEIQEVLCSQLQVQRPSIKNTGEDEYLGRPGEMAALMERFGLKMHSLAEQIQDTAAYLQP